MNAPYMGDFRVSQEFKGPERHDGLDLVGIDSKNIHCVVAGKVIYCGWENSKNKKQGFGQYVKIKAENGDIWYYGHLSKISVNKGDIVRVTDIIGVEGNTGHSTGSHLHICCRPGGIKARAKDVSQLLKIPNAKGIYNDGYTPNVATHTVVRGDTLWGIALKYLGNGSRYTEIMQINGLDRDIIYVGQKLKIPKK